MLQRGVISILRLHRVDSSSAGHLGLSEKRRGL
jgi:hypothetical protein